MTSGFGRVAMTAFENATKFFHACETLTGWEGCKEYVADAATFTAQCEPLVDLKTVKDYCDWMESVGSGPLKGCSYTLRASSYDESSKTALFFGTFTATHAGEGGPVPPTNKTTNTDYVYALTMGAGGKVEKMCKIWNAPWALNELGWA
jgi:hypothetical protein